MEIVYKVETCTVMRIEYETFLVPFQTVCTFLH